MIDIVFLGTGGGMPMTFRKLSSVMLSYQGRNILLDSGEGTQVGMREYHTGFKNLDWIFITHLHGDHVFGLPGLIATISNSERREDINIVGPKGAGEAIKNLLYTLNKLPFRIKIYESPKDLRLKVNKDLLIADDKGELIVDNFNLRHRIPCLAYSFYLERKPKFDVKRAKLLPIPIYFWKKLQNGEIIEYEGKKYYPEDVLGDNRRGIKLTFIGDTIYFPEMEDFAKDSDVLISEASYGDDEDTPKAKKNHHMTFRWAAELAKNARAKKLILTHFAPSMLRPEQFIKNATDTFPNTVLAYDGMRDVIKFEEE